MSLLMRKYELLQEKIKENEISSKTKGYATNSIDTETKKRIFELIEKSKKI